MKRYLFYFIPLLFISCATEPVRESEETIVQTHTEIEEFNPQEIISFLDIPEIDLIKSEYMEIPQLQTIPYPALMHDLLPSNPMLKLIELKKRYLSFNRIVESEFPQNYVSAIYIDNKNYYIGTVRGGFFRYNHSDQRILDFKSPRNSLLNLSITAIGGWGNEIIVCSFSGIYSYSAKKGTFDFLEEFPGNRSVTAMEVFNKFILFGTSAGELLGWDGMSFIQILKLDNHIIKKIYSINNKCFLLVSGIGLVEVLNRSGDYKLTIDINHSLLSRNINAIEYFDDTYWLSTSGEGIWKFDSEWKAGFQVIPDIWVHDSTSSENYLFFGTDRDGLIIYDKITGVWSSMGIREGLPTLSVPILQAYENDLYLSNSEKGIIIINDELYEKNL